MAEILYGVHVQEIRILENRQSRKGTERGEWWEKHSVIYGKMSNGTSFSFLKKALIVNLVSYLIKFSVQY